MAYFDASGLMGTPGSYAAEGYRLFGFTPFPAEPSLFQMLFGFSSIPPHSYPTPEKESARIEARAPALFREIDEAVARNKTKRGIWD